MKKLICSKIYTSLSMKIEHLSPEILESLIEIPEHAQYGDFALPCFIFAKQLKKNPAEIAMELQCHFQSKYIEKTEAVGPYLNIFINRALFAEKIVSIIGSNDRWGGNLHNTKTALVEHTSINPNASPHIGRARNAFIGSAIVNLLRFSGYQVDVHYFVNDIGKQISMLVYKLKDKKDIVFEELLSEYVKINELMKDNPSIETEVFNQLVRLENGDESMIRQFRRIVDICMNGQVNLFNELNIYYDYFDYESKYITSGRTSEIIELLKKSGKLFEDSDQRYVLNLDAFELEQNMLPLTRADKTSLYPLRDICFNIDKSMQKKEKNIVVLGEDQLLYGKQINAALEILGFSVPEIVNYSFVILADGKMSSRAGNVVLLKDVMEKAIEKTDKMFFERNGIHDLNKAKVIAYGAIKYAILSCGFNKNVMFDWDRILSLQGNSILFLQYNYARISKLKKNYFETDEDVKNLDFSSLKNDDEWLLLKTIFNFKAELNDILQNHYQISALTNYLYSITQIFSKWYHDTPILRDHNKGRLAMRMWIAEKTGDIIRNGLEILGIEVLEEI